MATVTSTAVANNTLITNHSGVTALTVEYNSGATVFSDSATTILMARVPHGATIVGITSMVTNGAATCPYDLGVESGTLSTFGNAIASGALSLSETGLPYDVSKTDTAVPYDTIKITPTSGTSTTSLKALMTVFYTMDSGRVAR